jgi:hypothetical protein
MTSDIAAFIWARLEEDAIDIDVIRRTDAHELTEDELNDPSCDFDGGWDVWGSFAERIDRVANVQRLQRGIEAKQRIARRHHPFVHAGQVGCRQCCVIPDWVDYPCADVRDVASEWAAHQEYRQEWSPS